MWCIVNLPNGTQQAVKWDPKAIGNECLEKVCKALGIICEMEYFGLEHWIPNQTETRTRQWINLRNRLSCDGCSSHIHLMLALRVKFWVPVHFILQESVRNLFYMQAKVDLLEGRLAARDWTNAAKLAALLCQADGIRFNELSLKAKCPIRLKKELAEMQLKQQQQQQQELAQQQLQQEQQNHLHQHKERKEKEYVLSFKKRRLSKQKSVESIENNCEQNINAESATATAAANASSSQAAAAALSIAAASSLLTPTPSTSNSAVHSSTSASSSSSTSVAYNHNNNSTASTSPSNSSTNSTTLDDQSLLLKNSPLRIYQDYIIRPTGTPPETQLPDDFLRQIANEHGKLSTLKMTPKSAKYWLLQEIQDLPGYGEEIFCGLTTNENSIRCDISVGANGIIVSQGDVKKSIPFSAIAAAKSFRRTFKLEYVDDHGNRKELEIKLPKPAIAAGLYRSITERHAFYVCDKVRGVVTNQFTRDLKGTIASMFKEDTELGKRYVFDIQHTCREVHDQARRILHERGIDVTANATASACNLGDGFEDLVSNLLPKSPLDGTETDDETSTATAAAFVSTSPLMSPLHFGASGAAGACIGASSMVGRLDLAIREKEEREAAIERCVDTRISEAMTCKICMDRAINTMFNPCCHVMACAQCAARCSNCPNCRVKITSVVKIYLPPELRMNQNETNEIAVSGECLEKRQSTASSNNVNGLNSIGRADVLNIAASSTNASAA